MEIMFHPEISVSIGMGKYLRDKIAMFMENILGPDPLSAYKTLERIRDVAGNLDEKADIFHSVVANMLW